MKVKIEFEAGSLEEISDILFDLEYVLEAGDYPAILNINNSNGDGSVIGSCKIDRGEV